MPRLSKFDLVFDHGPRADRSEFPPPRRATAAAPLIRVCSWCHHLIRGANEQGEPAPTALRDRAAENVTHGMCDACLAEMKADLERMDGKRTAANLDSRLPGLVKLLPDLPRDQAATRAREIAEADPSPDKKFTAWLIAQVADAVIRLPEDAARVRDALAFYHDQTRRNLWTGEKNFTRLTFHDLEDAVDAQRAVGAPKSKSEQTRETKAQGAQTMLDEPGFKVVKITAPEAMVFYAANTRWCVSDPATAASYLAKGPLWLIVDHGKKFLWHNPSGQYMNERDRPAEMSLEMADKLAPLVGGAVYRAPLKGTEFPKNVHLERRLLAYSDPHTLVLYAKRFYEKRGWPAAEPIIARSAEWAYNYASDVLLKPFPAGEPAIAKEGYWSYAYASFVLKGPFPAGEPAIAKEGDWSYNYARDVLNLPYELARRWGSDYRREHKRRATAESARYIYHVTFTDKVPALQKSGLRTMQTSNWVKTEDGQRYGQGQVYAFSNLQDAVKWAAKMDWEFNQQIGSGKISVLKLQRRGDWEADPAQADSPLDSWGAKGQWLRRMGGTKAEDIVAAAPITLAETRRLAAGDDITDEDLFNTRLVTPR